LGQRLFDPIPREILGLDWTFSETDETWHRFIGKFKAHVVPEEFSVRELAERRVCH